MNNIRSLAELLRQQGGDEDSVLAHISPEEAEDLIAMGGSGEINPVTGLPQYGRRRNHRYYDSGDNYSVNYDYEDEDEDDGFLSKLSKHSSDFFSSPANILSVGSSLANVFSRPKKKREKTGREKGLEQLEYDLASELPIDHIVGREKQLEKGRRWSPEEIRELMAYKQALERAQWEARNNLAPGETLDIDPIYRKDNDEDEFEKTGRWFEYYNDPEFKGKRVYMARGGEVRPPKEGFMEVSISTEPSGGISSLSDILRQFSGDNIASGYINGDDGGQDDTIDAKLSAGEYVIDAETVAHLGDGNSKNGAKKLDEFVKRIREYKRSSNHDDIAPSIVHCR